MMSATIIFQQQQLWQACPPEVRRTKLEIGRYILLSSCPESSLACTIDQKRSGLPYFHTRAIVSMYRRLISRGPPMNVGETQYASQPHSLLPPLYDSCQPNPGIGQPSQYPDCI